MRKEKKEYGILGCYKPKRSVQLINGVCYYDTNHFENIAITAFLALFITTAFSQNNTDQTCYSKYAKVFEKRGAKKVVDGVYDNVIISIRKGSMADCFYGKVTVKNGNIDYRNMFLKFDSMNIHAKNQIPTTKTVT